MLPRGHFAVFVGNTSDGWISEAIEAPKPLRGIIYRCGAKFFLDPLEAMEDKGPKYAILCLDLSEANIAILQGTSLDMRFHDESTVPQKQSRGGQSNKRFEKNRQLAIIAWFKTFSSAITDALLGEELAGIIISGPGLTKNEFNDSGYIHHELRKKIVGVVDTGYTGEQGVRETIQNASELLKETELVKQRNLMGLFFKMLGENSAATYGRQSVIDAILAGKARHTLMSAHDSEIESLTNQHGSDYKVISSEFEEGQQLKTVFGGIAAILRY
jgi:peptide chain release factor subunit 1